MSRKAHQHENYFISLSFNLWEKVLYDRLSIFTKLRVETWACIIQQFTRRPRISVHSRCLTILTSLDPKGPQMIPNELKRNERSWKVKFDAACDMMTIHCTISRTQICRLEQPWHQSRPFHYYHACYHYVTKKQCIFFTEISLKTFCSLYSSTKVHSRPLSSLSNLHFRPKS